jgi:aminoglycoside/choline kinase family phosphotransferase
MSSALAPDGTDVRSRIDQFLSETGLLSQKPAVVPLTGDASDRRYFRVLMQDAPSQVLSVHAGATDFARSPFVNVARLLDAMRLPAPRILGHSDELGILALEDLGDVTLQAHLGVASPDEHTALYREAVGLIWDMQHRARAHASGDYVPFGVAFDVAKLTWELEYFTKHFLEAYRGARLTEPQRAALTREYASITEELSSEPRVLCHRDYHSRNLMYHRGHLHIIDFQDARMGPDTYDLVSLLRDSYVDFNSAEVEGLMAWFLTLRGASESDDRDFRRRFDLMALQRNLKALGTFGFQTTSRNNPVYIQYIPRTLTYIRDNLSRYSRFDGLRDLLAEHLLELR